MVSYLPLLADTTPECVSVPVLSHVSLALEREMEKLLHRIFKITSSGFIYQVKLSTLRS